MLSVKRAVTVIKDPEGGRTCRAQLVKHVSFAYFTDPWVLPERGLGPFSPCSLAPALQLPTFAYAPWPLGLAMF